LTPEEAQALARLVPSLERACDELASLGIEDTVQHDDLHHGNVLVRDGRALVFDWGDACVSHPFLVLSVNLRFAADATGRADDDPRILALRAAYLEAWTDRAGAGELRRAADLACRIGQVSRTLTFHAVARAYAGVLDAYPGGLAGSLRRVLALFA
jgi:aminoglycoside phosphotransferase (APT) family kinase protein